MKKMSLTEMKSLTRNEMKSIMAGSALDTTCSGGGCSGNCSYTCGGRPEKLSAKCKANTSGVCQCPNAC